MSTTDNEMIEALDLDGRILAYASAGFVATVADAVAQGMPPDEQGELFGQTQGQMLATMRGWYGRVNACGGREILASEEARILYDEVCVQAELNAAELQ